MAPVKQLSDPVQIGSVRTRNRICIPPMVLYGHAGEDGMVTDAHVEHYRALAEGGAGLIIQEATCVSPEGRLRQDQLGIWAEDQVPGLKRIVEAVHGAGCPIFLQIHHGAVRDLSALSAVEIESLRDAFIDGCLRACRAGYDGVELHGCHSYLLCQFLNRRTNRRRDPYADGLVLIKEIYDGVRAGTSPDFVIGIRLGAFEPGLSEGIGHAKAVEAMGLQFLDISYGYAGEMDLTAPGDPKLSPPARGAAEIQKAVGIPVFAVEGIRTRADAEAVLAAGVEITDVGRSALVDPNWPEKVLRGEPAGACMGCRTCQWRIDPARCPGRILPRKKEEKQ